MSIKLIRQAEISEDFGLTTDGEADNELDTDTEMGFESDITMSPSVVETESEGEMTENEGEI